MGTAGARAAAKRLFLAVEDEPASLHLIARVLEKYGRVVTARDGEEAVEAFRRTTEGGGRFDAVFMDIRLPRMDGCEALEAMRAIEAAAGAARVPVVMTTGIENPEGVLAEYLARNDCLYLVKPVDEKKLREVALCVLLPEPEDP